MSKQLNVALSPVNSRMIASVGYEATGGVLVVKFVSDAIYVYRNVPMHIWQAFQAAESKGGFFRREIRDAFRFKQIRVRKVKIVG